MFSSANTKLKSLSQVPVLAGFLNKRKVYSFDLLSGHSCPFAEDCHSKVVVDNNRRKIVDGKHTEFRCFSASQEVLFTNVYNSRNRNFNTVRGKSLKELVSLIQENIPANLGICRIHVGGDFFSQVYFDSWLAISRDNPDRLFYAYTKSLPYWVKRKNSIPNNMVLTASRGGRKDSLIQEFGLRSVKVVYHPDDCGILEIDHDDSHAANPELRNQDFALLIHGVQPKDSEAAAAIKRLKNEGVKFSYSKRG